MIGAVTKFDKNKVLDGLREFFMGPIYPALVCIMVFLGHAFGLEFYFNAVNLILVSVALLVSTSLRPVIVVLCTFTYQINPMHSPGYPAFSDYYLTGARPYIIVALFVPVALALIYFYYKNGLITKKSLKALPLKLSFPIFTVAFLLSGVGNPIWCFADIGYAALQVLCLFIVFYLLYLGLREENPYALADYFVYVAALMMLLLVGEMANALITSENAFVDGSIDRNIFDFGWGVSNVLGVNLVALIPLMFYGFSYSKRPIVYYLLAVLNYVAALVVLSRNSMLIGSLVFALGIIICCFFGERKRLCRVLTAILMAVAVLVALLFLDDILLLLKRYLTSGFNDSGRFELWKLGFASFLEYPIFGKGFFGMQVSMPEMASFLPNMVHNTLFQLLGATGIVGTLAYGFYRYQTLLPFIKRPSLKKTLLGISALVLLLESLLDNFIFYMQPTFVYSVALVIVFMMCACGPEEHKPRVVVLPKF